ncbi:MAG: nuclear transport factor 2 family protein [Gammaproteobacteria bacterium]
MKSARLVSSSFTKHFRSTTLLAAALLLVGCSQDVPQQSQQQQSPQQQAQQPQQQPASDAADRLAILDVQNRYILAMDYFDADGYAAVFTEDGVLDWARGEVIGRDAIREFMATGTYDLRKLNFQPAQTEDGREWPPAVRHLVTNQVIEISGDTARVISYWMNYSNAADRRQIQWLSYGSWDDEMVKVDGQWYFKRHKIYNENNPNRFTAGQENPLAQ